MGQRGSRQKCAPTERHDSETLEVLLSKKDPQESFGLKLRWVAGPPAGLEIRGAVAGGIFDRWCKKEHGCNSDSKDGHGRRTHLDPLVGGIIIAVNGVSRDHRLMDEQLSGPAVELHVVPPHTQKAATRTRQHGSRRKCAPMMSADPVQVLLIKKEPKENFGLNLRWVAGPPAGLKILGAVAGGVFERWCTKQEGAMICKSGGNYTHGKGSTLDALVGGIIISVNGVSREHRLMDEELNGPAVEMYVLPPEPHLEIDGLSIHKDAPARSKADSVLSMTPCAPSGTSSLPALSRDTVNGSSKTDTVAKILSCDPPVGIMEAQSASLSAMNLCGNEYVDSHWVEFQAQDGSVYFWHLGTNMTVWAMPQGISAGWVCQPTADGNVYYWSRSTGEVTWQLPVLQSIS